MPDVLIRDLPDEVLAAIDARAARAGLSRNAYLRRVLASQHAPNSGPVRVEDLRRLSSLAADLEDRDVMSKAWS